MRHGRSVCRLVVLALSFLCIMGMVALALHVYLEEETGRIFCTGGLSSTKNPLQSIPYRSINRALVYSSFFSGELESSGMIPVLESNAVQKAKKLQLVCYYGLPAKTNEIQLQPEDLDANLCTHIILAFAKLRNNSLEPANPSDIDVYNRTVALKQKNPNLKVMVSSVGSFPEMVKSKRNREHFINQSLEFLIKNKLDGLDLDWEFPAWSGHKEEKYSFTDFLQEFREELERRKLPFLFTVAVGAPKTVVDKSYEVAKIAKYVDFVNLMAYDFHFYTWYTPVTGANAPLYQRKVESSYFATLNTNWTAYYWVQNGMPKDKIMIGVPTYGHSFTLADASHHGLDAPASGIGTIGSAGFANYPQVCDFLNANASVVFENESLIPYAFKELQWLSYDNEESLIYKTKWAKDNQFAGVMVLSLDNDDFKKLCRNSTKAFPLTAAIKSAL